MEEEFNVESSLTAAGKQSQIANRKSQISLDFENRAERLLICDLRFAICDWFINESFNLNSKTSLGKNSKENFNCK